MERPDGVLVLADVKRAGAPLLRNGSAALWDIGDGVACFEFTSKMNALDADTLELLGRSIALVAERHRAMVVYNEGPNFSVGANLGLALFALNVGLWGQLEELVAKGQQVYRALKYAPFPTVGAPSGLALGGGCEILLHCAAVQAHAETYMGLVETGVGIVPAWGGCKEMLLRQMADRAPPRRADAADQQGVRADQPRHRREVGGRREAAPLSASRRRHHDEPRPAAGGRQGQGAGAGRRAIGRPPRRPRSACPARPRRWRSTWRSHAFARLGKATAHDQVVAGALAEVLSGGADADITQPLTEDDLLALERRSFMRLIRQPASIARIEHMLETGKPLRN